MTLRFQQGGTLPLAEYLPFTGLQTASDTSVPAAGGTSSQASEGQKDLLKLVSQMKGLPSDASKLIEDLQDVYSETNLFNNGELDAQDLTTTYLSTLQKIKFAEFNEDQFKQAEKSVRDNGGLHEYAIDSYGRLIVQNSKNGKIKHMSLQDFYAQGDNPEYIPLTNSNLLYYRAQSPEFAFKNDFIEVASNGIGQEKVTKMLQDSLAKIGSTSISDEGYTARQQGEITKGISILQDLARQGKSADEIWGENGLLSLDGLYKTASLNQDQKQQIKQAATYLWATMPKNARTWLAMKSGNTSDPNKGAQDLMMTLLFAHETTKSDFKVDYQKDLTINGDKVSTKSGSDDDKVNHYISMQNKIHGTYGTFELNSGTNNSLMVEGTKYGSLPDFNGKPVGTTSMSKLFAEGLSGIVEDMKGISFGDHVVDPNDLSNIWYDGSGGMMVDLPCKIVNGTKVVDLGVLDSYNRAYEQFKALPKDQQTSDAFGEILQQFGLYQLLDGSGLPNKSLFGQFLVVTGYGVDKNNTLWQNQNGEKNRYLEDVDTSNEALMETISRDLSTDSKKSNYTIDTENWFESSDPEGFFTYDHVYKGTLYIPISNNEGQGHNAAGQKLGYDVMHEDERRYQQEQKRRTMRDVGSGVLY